MDKSKHHLPHTCLQSKIIKRRSKINPKKKLQQKELHLHTSTTSTPLLSSQSTISRLSVLQPASTQSFHSFSTKFKSILARKTSKQNHFIASQFFNISNRFYSSSTFSRQSTIPHLHQSAPENTNNLFTAYDSSPHFTQFDSYSHDYDSSYTQTKPYDTLIHQSRREFNPNDIISHINIPRSIHHSFSDYETTLLSLHLQNFETSNQLPTLPHEFGIDYSYTPEDQVIAYLHAKHGSDQTNSNSPTAAQHDSTQLNLHHVYSNVSSSRIDIPKYHSAHVQLLASKRAKLTPHFSIRTQYSLLSRTPEDISTYPQIPLFPANSVAQMLELRAYILPETNLSKILSHFQQLFSDQDHESVLSYFHQLGQNECPELPHLIALYIEHLVSKNNELPNSTSDTISLPPQHAPFLQTFSPSLSGLSTFTYINAALHILHLNAIIPNEHTLNSLLKFTASSPTTTNNDINIIFAQFQQLSLPMNHTTCKLLGHHFQLKKSPNSLLSFAKQLQITDSLTNTLQNDQNQQHRQHSNLTKVGYDQTFASHLIWGHLQLKKYESAMDLLFFLYDEDAKRQEVLKSYDSFEQFYTNQLNQTPSLRLQHLIQQDSLHEQRLGHLNDISSDFVNIENNNNNGDGDFVAKKSTQAHPSSQGLLLKRHSMNSEEFSTLLQQKQAEIIEKKNHLIESNQLLLYNPSLPTYLDMSSWFTSLSPSIATFVLFSQHIRDKLYSIYSDTKRFTLHSTHYYTFLTHPEMNSEFIPLISRQYTLAQENHSLLISQGLYFSQLQAFFIQECINHEFTLSVELLRITVDSFRSTPFQNNTHLTVLIHALHQYVVDLQKKKESLYYDDLTYATHQSYVISLQTTIKQLIELAQAVKVPTFPPIAQLQQAASGSLTQSASILPQSIPFGPFGLNGNSIGRLGVRRSTGVLPYETFDLNTSVLVDLDSTYIERTLHQISVLDANTSSLAFNSNGELDNIIDENGYGRYGQTDGNVAGQGFFAPFHKTTAASRNRYHESNYFIPQFVSHIAETAQCVIEIIPTVSDMNNAKGSNQSATRSSSSDEIDESSSDLLQPQDIHTQFKHLLLGSTFTRDVTRNQKEFQLLTILNNYPQVYPNKSILPLNYPSLATYRSRINRTSPIIHLSQGKDDEYTSFAESKQYLSETFHYSRSITQSLSSQFNSLYTTYFNSDIMNNSPNTHKLLQTSKSQLYFDGKTYVEPSQKHQLSQNQHLNALTSQSFDYSQLWGLFQSIDLSTPHFNTSALESSFVNHFPDSDNSDNSAFKDRVINKLDYLTIENMLGPISLTDHNHIIFHYGSPCHESDIISSLRTFTSQCKQHLKASTSITNPLLKINREVQEQEEIKRLFFRFASQSQQQSLLNNLSFDPLAIQYGVYDVYSNLLTALSIFSGGFLIPTSFLHIPPQIPQNAFKNTQTTSQQPATVEFNLHIKVGSEFQPLASFSYTDLKNALDSLYTTLSPQHRQIERNLRQFYRTIGISPKILSTLIQSLTSIQYTINKTSQTMQHITQHTKQLSPLDRRILQDNILTTQIRDRLYKDLFNLNKTIIPRNLHEDLLISLVVSLNKRQLIRSKGLSSLELVKQATNALNQRIIEKKKLINTGLTLAEVYEQLDMDIDMNMIMNDPILSNSYRGNSSDDLVDGVPKWLIVEIEQCKRELAQYHKTQLDLAISNSLPSKKSIHSPVDSQNSPLQTPNNETTIPLNALDKITPSPDAIEDLSFDVDNDKKTLSLDQQPFLVQDFSASNSVHYDMSTKLSLHSPLSQDPEIYTPLYYSQQILNQSPRNSTVHTQTSHYNIPHLISPYLLTQLSRLHSALVDISEEFVSASRKETAWNLHSDDYDSDVDYGESDIDFSSDPDASENGFSSAAKDEKKLTRTSQRLEQLHKKHEKNENKFSSNGQKNDTHTLSLTQSNDKSLSSPLSNRLITSFSPGTLLFDFSSDLTNSNSISSPNVHHIHHSTPYAAILDKVQRHEQLSLALQALTKAIPTAQFQANTQNMSKTIPKGILHQLEKFHQSQSKLTSQTPAIPSSLSSASSSASTFQSTQLTPYNQKNQHSFAQNISQPELQTYSHFTNIIQAFSHNLIESASILRTITSPLDQVDKISLQLHPFQRTHHFLKLYLNAALSIQDVELFTKLSGVNFSTFTHPVLSSSSSLIPQTPATNLISYSLSLTNKHHISRLSPFRSHPSHSTAQLIFPALLARLQKFTPPLTAVSKKHPQPDRKSHPPTTYLLNPKPIAPYLLYQRDSPNEYVGTNAHLSYPGIEHLESMFKLLLTQRTLQDSHFKAHAIVDFVIALLTPPQIDITESNNGNQMNNNISQNSENYSHDLTAQTKLVNKLKTRHLTDINTSADNTQDNTNMIHHESSLSSQLSNQHYSNQNTDQQLHFKHLQDQHRKLVEFIFTNSTLIQTILTTYTESGYHSLALNFYHHCYQLFGSKLLTAQYFALYSDLVMKDALRQLEISPIRSLTPALAPTTMTDGSIDEENRKKLQKNVIQGDHTTQNGSNVKSVVNISTSASSNPTNPTNPTTSEDTVMNTTYDYSRVFDFRYISYQQPSFLDQVDQFKQLLRLDLTKYDATNFDHIISNPLMEFIDNNTTPLAHHQSSNQQVHYDSALSHQTTTKNDSTLTSHATLASISPTLQDQMFNSLSLSFAYIRECEMNQTIPEDEYLAKILSVAMRCGLDELAMSLLNHLSPPVMDIRQLRYPISLQATCGGFYVVPSADASNHIKLENHQTLMDIDDTTQFDHKLTKSTTDTNFLSVLDSMDGSAPTQGSMSPNKTNRKDRFYDFIDESIPPQNYLTFNLCWFEIMHHYTLAFTCDGTMSSLFFQRPAEYHNKFLNLLRDQHTYIGTNKTFLHQFHIYRNEIIDSFLSPVTPNAHPLFPQSPSSTPSLSHVKPELTRGDILQLHQQYGSWLWKNALFKSAKYTKPTLVSMRDQFWYSIATSSPVPYEYINYYHHDPHSYLQYSNGIVSSNSVLRLPAITKLASNEHVSPYSTYNNELDPLNPGKNGKSNSDSENFERNELSNLMGMDVSSSQTSHNTFQNDSNQSQQSIMSRIFAQTMNQSFNSHPSFGSQTKRNDQLSDPSVQLHVKNITTALRRLIDSAAIPSPSTPQMLYPTKAEIISSRKMLDTWSIDSMRYYRSTTFEALKFYGRRVPHSKKGLKFSLPQDLLQDLYLGRTCNPQYMHIFNKYPKPPSIFTTVPTDLAQPIIDTSPSSQSPLSSPVSPPSSLQLDSFTDSFTIATSQPLTTKSSSTSTHRPTVLQSPPSDSPRLSPATKRKQIDISKLSLSLQLPLFNEQAFNTASAEMTLSLLQQISDPKLINYAILRRSLKQVNGTLQELLNAVQLIAGFDFSALRNLPPFSPPDVILAYYAYFNEIFSKVKTITQRFGTWRAIILNQFELAKYLPPSIAEVKESHLRNHNKSATASAFAKFADDFDNDDDIPLQSHTPNTPSPQRVQYFNHHGSSKHGGLRLDILRAVRRQQYWLEMGGKHPHFSIPHTSWESNNNIYQDKDYLELKQHFSMHDFQTWTSQHGLGSSVIDPINPQQGVLAKTKHVKDLRGVNIQNGVDPLFSHQDALDSPLLRDLPSTNAPQTDGKLPKELNWRDLRLLSISDLETMKAILTYYRRKYDSSPELGEVLVDFATESGHYEGDVGNIRGTGQDFTSDEAPPLTRAQAIFLQEQLVKFNLLTRVLQAKLRRVEEQNFKKDYFNDILNGQLVVENAQRRKFGENALVSSGNVLLSYSSSSDLSLDSPHIVVASDLDRSSPPPPPQQQQFHFKQRNSLPFQSFSTEGQHVSSDDIASSDDAISIHSNVYRNFRNFCASILDGSFVVHSQETAFARRSGFYRGVPNIPNLDIDRGKRGQHPNSKPKQGNNNNKNNNNSSNVSKHQNAPPPSLPQRSLFSFPQNTKPLSHKSDDPFDGNDVNFGWGSQSAPKQ